MICLDNTDTLEGGASVAAVVDYTVHGLVGSTFTQLAAGQLSDTDPSVLYTAGAGISIVSVTLVNTHSAAVTVNLYLDPANGGNPRRLIAKDLSLGIGYSLHFDGARITVMDASGGILKGYIAHATDHENDGDDEINVSGLSGLLADDQHVLDAEVVLAAQADPDIASAITLKHTQNTDTDLDATFKATLAKSGANADITSMTGLDDDGIPIAKVDGAIANLSEDTTPELGGNLDLNEKGIAYDWILTSDHTYSGDVITATAGESLAIGDVCYFKSGGKFWKMDAGAAATTKGMCAMATATISADASGVFLLKGLIRDDTWTWTVAAELWVSCTPGNPTETQPSGSGDQVRLIGYAKSADYIWFEPDKTYVEVS